MAQTEALLMHARASLALLRRRPDIITAKRHLAASNVRVGAPVADYYPDADRQLLAAQDSSQARKADAA